MFAFLKKVSPVARQQSYSVEASEMMLEVKYSNSNDSFSGEVFCKRGNMLEVDIYVDGIDIN